MSNDSFVNGYFFLNEWYFTAVKKKKSTITDALLLKKLKTTY